MTNTPPPRNKLPAWLLLLLAAFGVPGLTAWAIAAQLTQNPWSALGIGLLLELLLFIVGFVGKVWGELEPRWVDRAADWVDARVSRLSRGYDKRYREYLGYRHRDFDVKGLTTQGVYTLALKEVFVELSIAPRPPHEISADPIQPIPTELRGRKTIWDFLTSDALRQQQLALIGAPGSGKTTLLKHMTLALAGSASNRRRQGAPDLLPVLLFLRDHRQVIVGIRKLLWPLPGRSNSLPISPTCSPPPHTVQ